MQQDDGVTASNHGFEVYRRLLTLSLPHWRIFLLGILGMVANGLTDVGFAYLMKKDYGKAVEVLEGLVEGEDIPAYMLNNMGLAYEGAGRLQEAMSSFKQAVEKNPKYINAKINLDRLVTLAKRAEQEVPSATETEWEQPFEEPEDETDDLIIVDPE